MEKEIKCSFCSISYSLTGEKIIRFSCGHEYCQNCLFYFFFLDIYSLLQDYVTNESIALPCPICKEGLFQKSGNILFKLFESNYMKIKQKNNNKNKYNINQKKIMKNKISKCKKHQLPANIYCEQCTTIFCKKCLSIHNEIGNRHHSLINLNYSNTNDNNNNNKFKCINHEGEELLYFCENCHELICNQCYARKHKEHKVFKKNVFIENSLKNIKSYRESNFNEALFKLSEKKNNFEEKFQEDYQMTMFQLDKIISYFQQMKQDYTNKMDELYIKENELNDLLLLSYNIINEEIKNINNIKNSNSTNNINNTNYINNDTKMNINELDNNINNSSYNNYNLFNIFFLNEIANSKNGEINNQKCNFMLNSINNCLLNTQISSHLNSSEKSQNEETKLFSLINDNNNQNKKEGKYENENNLENDDESDMNEEEEEIINILEQNKIEQEKIDNKNNNSYSNNSNNDNLIPIQMSYMEKLKGYKLTGNTKKINYKGSITLNLNTSIIKNSKETTINNNNNTNENIFSLLPNIKSLKIFFLSDKNNKNNEFIWDSNYSLTKNNSYLNNNKEKKDLVISENEITRIAKDKCNIEIYKGNNIRPYQKLSGHDAKINCLILIKNRTFCTASDDCKIKLWELINGLSEEKYYCKQTLKEHKKEVNEIIFMNNKLISCSNDTTIKVWNYDNDLGMSYVQTLNQHKTSIISLLQLTNDTFISSDKSFLLNVWTLENIEKDKNDENK